MCTTPGVSYRATWDSPSVNAPNLADPVVFVLSETAVTCMSAGVEGGARLFLSGAQLSDRSVFPAAQRDKADTVRQPVWA